MENAELLSYISSFCTGRKVVLLGDFNLLFIDWSGLVPVATAALSRSFLDMFNSLGLTQWVFFPTFLQSGNVLDLVFTSEDDLVSEVRCVEPFPGCGHVGILFFFSCSDSSSLCPAISPVKNLDWFRF